MKPVAGKRNNEKKRNLLRDIVDELTLLSLDDVILRGDIMRINHIIIILTIITIIITIIIIMTYLGGMGGAKYALCACAKSSSVPAP